MLKFSIECVELKTSHDEDSLSDNFTYTLYIITFGSSQDPGKFYQQNDRKQDGQDD